jgi:hypothetical protein
MHLTSVCSALVCQKRRIYDITNVFEGLGMIVKEGQSDVRYSNDIGSSFTLETPEETPGDAVRDSMAPMPQVPDAAAEVSSRLEGEIRYLEELIASMDVEEHMLQEAVKDVVGQKANSLRLYVTDQDVSWLPIVKKNDQLLAIMAPHGTNIEIDRERGGSIHVDSSVHELEIYSLTGRTSGRTINLDSTVPSDADDGELHQGAEDGDMNAGDTPRM